MQSSRTITYRRVAILKPGKFQDETGRTVEFNAADLALIADNYDPAFHAASVNIDHQDHCPALGLVSDLVFDGEYLLADLIQVPAKIAEALDAGSYPFRSAEVYPDLGGKGLYLRAVALLGAKPPAVKGLPPIPTREAKPTEQADIAQRQVAVGQGPSGLSRNANQQPMIYTTMTEAFMSDKTDENQPTVQLAEASDPVRLAEENYRLAEENRNLKHAERERQVTYFLSELREAGKLTPALEQAGVKEALVAADEQALIIKLANGTQAPLSQVLKEILKALPTAVSFGIATPSAAETKPGLSHDELAVAASLGLSDAEYLASQAVG